MTFTSIFLKVSNHFYLESTYFQSNSVIINDLGTMSVHLHIIPPEKNICF